MVQHRTFDTAITLSDDSPRAVMASNLAIDTDMTFTVIHNGDTGEITFDLVDCNGSRLALATVTPGNQTVVNVTVPAGNWAAMNFLPPGSGGQSMLLKIGPRTEDGLTPPIPNQGDTWNPLQPAPIDKIKTIIPSINWDTPYYF